MIYAPTWICKDKKMTGGANALNARHHGLTARTTLLNDEQCYIEPLSESERHIAPVYTIVYRSIPVFTGSVANYLSEIDGILATARKRNAEVSVTGAMLFNEDWFVQLLEGDEADVRATFDRIAVDARHDGVQILFDSTTSARRFPEWSMAFVGDAAAIRRRFANSPIANHHVTLRGEEVVDFVVDLARENSR